MRIFPRGADETLSGIIDTISASPSAWRAIYFEFSAQPNLVKDFPHFQTFADLLLKPLESISGSAIPLNNTDFVLVAKGITNQQINEALLRAQHLFKERKDNADIPATVYDLSFQYLDFKDKCDRALTTPHH